MLGIVVIEFGGGYKGLPGLKYTDSIAPFTVNETRAKGATLHLRNVDKNVKRSQSKFRR